MDNKKAVGLAVAGLVAGAVAGVLLAPKSGEETREDLKHLAEKMKGQIGDKVAQMTKVTKEAYTELVHNVVKQYEDTKEVTAEEAQALKDQLGESYENIKNAAKDEGMDVEEDEDEEKA